MSIRTPTAQGRSAFHSYWGIYLNPAALPNVAGAPIQDASLEEGDTAYVDRDQTTYVCLDPSQNAAIWLPGSGAATTLRHYGSTTLVFGKGITPIPASVSDVLDVVDRSGGHVELWRDFDAYYARCRVRLRFYATGSGSLLLDTTQVFASQAAILAFVNTNVNTSFGTSDDYVEMEVFDIEDASMVPPPKIYGKNRFFAGLVSRTPQGRYYGYKTGSCFYADQSSAVSVAARAQVFESMWASLYSANPMPPAASWTANEFGCFWLPRNRVRRYDMPAFTQSGLAIEDGAGKDRFVRQAGITIPRPGLGGVSTIYNALADSQIVYGYIDPGGSTGSTFDISTSFKTIAQLLTQGASILVGYPLVRNQGGADEELSVLIKPIGVDQFYVDPYDDARLQLEVVGVQRQNWRTKIRPIVGLPQAPTQRIAGPVDVPTIAASFGLEPAIFRVGGQAGRHGYFSGRARFQYRDLVTNRVSPMTQAMIVPVVRRRARPFALMVRNVQET